MCPIICGVGDLYSVCASAGQTWKISCRVIFHDQEVIAALWNLINANILTFLKWCVCAYANASVSIFFFFPLDTGGTQLLEKAEVPLFRTVPFRNGTLCGDRH